MNDYLGSMARGQNTLQTHMNNLMDPEFKTEVEPEKIEKLKGHLDEIEKNPTSMLDIGGNLSDPNHIAQVAAHAARAVNYLQSIKPTVTQLSPLDTVPKVSKADTAYYDRQLAVAENPMMVLHRAKNNTLLPSDLQALNSIYPGLQEKMQAGITDQLIKAKDKPLSYKMKQGLSSLIGQNLDTTQSPMALQAIMQANAGSTAGRLPQPKQKKASGVELKQINKVNAMDFTPTQAREANKIEEY